jgi:anti-sigma factor RsiW
MAVILRRLWDMLRRPWVMRRLPAYIRGELPVESRREIARWVDADTGVEAAAADLRRTDADLRRELGGIGRAAPSQLERGWAQIGAALDGRAPLWRVRAVADWRRSAAAAVMAALLLIPLLVSGTAAASVFIPTQPRPQTLDDVITPTGEGQDVRPADTLTPPLATASFRLRATPTAPDSN